MVHHAVFFAAEGGGGGRETEGRRGHQGQGKCSGDGPKKKIPEAVRDAGAVVVSDELPSVVVDEDAEASGSGRGGD